MRATASRRSSKPRELRQIDADVESRFVNLRVVFKREETGEKLFEVGGEWDRVEHRYTDRKPKRAKAWNLNEAQCIGEPGKKLEDGPAWSLKSWIEARREGRRRVIELIFDGGRGSGKSHLGVLAVFAIAIAFPDARCWLVSPANTRRHELIRIIRDQVPLAWRSAFSERDQTYTLPNGSQVTLFGADDEDALKQGGYEVALLNEAQLMTSLAFSNAAGGVRNVSARPTGLLMLAFNYASKERGEWTNDHLDKIESGTINARHHKLDPKLNKKIGKEVVDDVDAVIRSVRPDLADIDSQGIRRRLGTYATPAFKPHAMAFKGHVGKPPKSWRDVTRIVTAAKLGVKTGFAYVIGTDFQRRPGCVGVLFKLYQREDRKVVYWAEHIIQAADNEDDLARRIDQYLGYRALSARDALIVADSTGRHQDFEHNPSPNTKPSHQILREWYFTVVAPARPKKRGGWGIGNPDVDDSLSQFYDICTANRFIVSDEPGAEFLVESLKKCRTKKRGGSLRLDDRAPGYSHPVDCSRYVTWYFEPRRGPADPTPAVDPFEALSQVQVSFSE